MYKFDNSDDGVYTLITKLCVSMFRDVDDDFVNWKAVTKYRAKAYEVLLKQYPLNQTAPRSTDYDSFHSELQRQIFTTRLVMHSNENMAQRNQTLILCKEQVNDDNEFFNTQLGIGFLFLMLKLSEPVESFTGNERTCHLLTPQPLKMFCHSENNQYHLHNRKLQCVVRPRPKYFKGIDRLQANEYDSANMFSPKFTSKLQLPSNAKFETYETTRITGKFSGLMPNQYSCISYNRERITKISYTIKKPKGQKKQHWQPITMDYVVYPRLYTWESYECLGARRMKYFATDLNVSYELMSLDSQLKGQKFEPLVMSIESFVRDLKALAIGIQSETFQQDDYNMFQMVDNVSVEGILPNEILKYVEPYLNCGTCFKHLNKMAKRLEFEHRLDGFLYKSMCSAVTQYLLTFRQFVLAQNEFKLASLYKNMRSMMEQLVELAMTLTIDTEVDLLQRSRSSYFLTYIWQQIQECTKNDYITLLMFILKQMCHVYFKRLQNWAMHGTLDDPCKELFISYVEHYPEKTKNFFDRAYFIETTAVPGFLRNCEQSILNCGKYTMLLKSFKPNHPLFNLKCPDIRLCFNEDDLQSLTNDCEAYLTCGRTITKPICMTDIYTARAIAKQNFKAYVKQRDQARIDAWQQQQTTARQDTLQQKKQFLETLNQQKKEQLQRMLDKRTEKIAEELQCQRQLEQFETTALAHENINLRKRIEYITNRGITLRDDIVNVTKEIKRELHWQAGKTNVVLGETQDNDDENLTTTKLKHSASNVEKELKLDVVVPKIRRSLSDVLNSNETQPLKQLTEMELNRQRNLDSVVFSTDTFTAMARVQLNENENSLNGKTLTEAQSNKLRVMTEHTGVFVPTTTTTTTQTQTADINLNVLPEKSHQVSDLERNRNQMMYTDMFTEFNKPEDMHAERARRHLCLDSELARNRQRVLNSEYDISTGERNVEQNRFGGTNEGVKAKPTLDLVDEIQTIDETVEVNTPMSTTSDVSAGSVFEECQLVAEIETLDACNNNSSSSRSQNDSTSEYQDAMSETKNLELELSAHSDSNKDVEVNKPIIITNSWPDDIDTDANIKEQKNRAELFAGIDLTQQQRLIIENIAKASACFQTEFKALCQTYAVNNADCNDNANALPPYYQLFMTIKNGFRFPALNSCLRMGIKLDTTMPTGSKQHTKSKCSYVNHHSTIMIKHFLQHSLMRPLQAHFYLVRNEVMRIFFEDLRIYEHFRSFRNYFFLMDGEFGEFITDGIIGQLESGKTPQKLLNYQVLHDVLDKAIASSLAGATKYTENLSFIVKDMPEEFKLSSPDALKSLSLSYTVEWPLNLILNSDARDRYTMIFQYLFKLRRVSYVLERVYQYLKEPIHQRNGRILLTSPQYRHVQMIRHKLAHFVNSLQNYLAASVLQASWMKFKDVLRTVDTVESLYQTHVMYLKEITFLCLLNRKSVKIRESINNIFTIALRFCKVLTSTQFVLDEQTQQFTHERYQRLVYEEQEFEKFLKYTIYLGEKVVRHGYQEEIRHFIGLVNINGYYKA